MQKFKIEIISISLFLLSLKNLLSPPIGLHKSGLISEVLFISFSDKNSLNSEVVLRLYSRTSLQPLSLSKC